MDQKPLNPQFWSEEMLNAHRQQYVLLERYVAPRVHPKWWWRYTYPFRRFAWAMQAAISAFREAW